MRATTMVVGNAVATGSRKLEIVTEALQTMGPYRPDWLTVDHDQRRVTVLDHPDGGAAPFPVDLQLVVEFYSRSI